jgi:hypothetical protein
MRRAAIVAVLTCLATVPAARAERLPAPLDPCRTAATPADGPAGLHEYVGAMHEHSAYSDGFPGSIPTDYFRSGRCFGLNFLFAGEHSDNLQLPTALSEYCLPPASPAPCALSDPDTPADSFRKWDAMTEQADAEQTDSFTTARGFEWSSDRFGHINVYFSRNQVNAKIDGGYATMDTFYAWAKRPPELLGGGDGLMTFNHPGDKKLADGDPALNWNDFAYEPSADAQMAGIELFNGTKDFGPYYTRALDKGWHVGAVGAEDKGHDPTDHWGADNLGKTVFLAADGSRAALKDAMRDRRMYATLGRGLRLDFTVDDAVMGSRLERIAGDPLKVDGALRGWDGEPLDGDVTLELVGNGGTVLATGRQNLTTHIDAPAAGERWVYLRALRDGKPVAYSSPVWIADAGRTGEWLAGDLHVHTCFSHDVFCGPLDEPFQIEPGDDPAELAAEEVQYLSDPGNLQQLYAYGMTVGERFAEASLRGLDYLAITDHGDTRSVTAPGFGTAGVVGIPGYENSIKGHAQVLGATHVLSNGDGSAAAIRTLQHELHAQGGVLQANHPGYTTDTPFASCDQDPQTLHWRYGYDVPVDSIEVWNPTASVQDAEAYLECWLARGGRPAVTGGGDSHWKSTLPVQGVGNPTTWVLAKSRTRVGVLAAVRAGRTTVSRFSPTQGGAPLLIEVQRGDAWVNAIGEEVAPGAALRVRVDGPAAAGVVTIRANGADIVTEEPLTPGGTVAFTAPDHGWVRARLHSIGEATKAAPGCAHELGSNEKASSCAYDHSLLGLTSPAYIAG